eukprot:2865858-Karenia_brevis.AAC.1
MNRNFRRFSNIKSRHKREKITGGKNVITSGGQSVVGREASVFDSASIEVCHGTYVDKFPFIQDRLK